MPGMACYQGFWITGMGMTVFFENCVSKFFSSAAKIYHEQITLWEDEQEDEQEEEHGG